jgi:hypothetical protein
MPLDNDVNITVARTSGMYQAIEQICAGPINWEHGIDERDRLDRRVRECPQLYEPQVTREEDRVFPAYKPHTH